MATTIARETSGESPFNTRDFYMVVTPVRLRETPSQQQQQTQRPGSRSKDLEADIEIHVGQNPSYINTDIQRLLE